MNNYNVTEAKLYKEENEIIGFSCKINNVEHYTADVRTSFNKITAVCSDSTNTEKPKYKNTDNIHITKSGILDCVKLGVYLVFEEIKIISVQEDYYTYIEIKEI